MISPRCRQSAEAEPTHVTSSETSKTAVTQSSIDLVVDEVFDVESELVQGLLKLNLGTEVQHGVVKEPPHQELQRKVVDTLRVLRSMELWSRNRRAVEMRGAIA